MRIGIDIRCLTDGKRTGVEEYTLNLLEHLFKIDQENKYILFINSFHEPKIDLTIFDSYKNVIVKRFRYPNKILNFLFWYLRWPHVDQMLGGVDCFFMPNINFIGLSNKSKLVLTIHDLSYELFSQTFSLKRKFWHFLINSRGLVKRSSAIIAVSESTKNDLVKYYNVSSEKIAVIYNGIRDDFRAVGRNDEKLIEVKRKYHLPFNFIFYLGTIEPRKNINALVSAFDALKEDSKKYGRLKLVIAGMKGWKTDKILDFMRSAKYTDDIIYTDQITNEDKPYVYQLASLFVYPSFFEGFGFPVLEAMRCDVPVITSNTSSIPEVVGDAAIMIDPDKPDEILNAMKQIFDDKDLQEIMRSRGMLRASHFSWKKTAKETYNLFKRLKRNF